MISERKRKLQLEKSNELALHVLDVLDTINQLCKDGKNDEAEECRKELQRELQEDVERIKEETEKPVVNTEYKRLLPTAGEILAENERIILRAFSENDRQNYLDVSKEHSYLKSYYSETHFLEELWNGCMSDSAAYFSISLSDYGTFIGYCAIKDISKDEWEIAIELDKKYIGQGYGYQALLLMFGSIYSLTGMSNFSSLVDADNYRSQALMKKLGGVPDGIREFLIHGEELEQFENDNLELIDDKLREVAHEFNVEPRKLLSHVLAYRFDISRME